jgi:acetoin utilization protein AcuB
MRVVDVMTRRVESVSAEGSAEGALRQMRLKRIRHLVATRDGKVVGVVSSRDLESLGSLRLRRAQIVADVMSSPAVTAAPDMTLRQAANLLRGRTIGCLPVMDEGKLVGILTLTDVLELIGRGVERPATKGKRWILKGRGPRRKSVVGHKGFVGH